MGGLLVLEDARLTDQRPAAQTDMAFLRIVFCIVQQLPNVPVELRRVHGQRLGLDGRPIPLFQLQLDLLLLSIDVGLWVVFIDALLVCLNDGLLLPGFLGLERLIIDDRLVLE